MATVAVYRFDETGSVTRNGQVGAEPALDISFGTISDVAGLLANAASMPSGSGALLTSTGGAGSLTSIRDHSVSMWIQYISPTGGFVSSSFKLQGAGSQFINIGFGTPAGLSFLSASDTAGSQTVTAQATNPAANQWVSITWTEVWLTPNLMPPFRLATLRALPLAAAAEQFILINLK